MASLTGNDAIKKQAHHQRKQLCETRPTYRQGKKLTSVRVYTVNDESRHLLIHGVPAIAVAAELQVLCQRFGSVEELKLVTDYPTEKFCEVYYARFRTVQSARFAKNHLDDRSFFGGVLHVCYAPELERVEDTRDKLVVRKREIEHRLNPRKRSREWTVATADRNEADDEAVRPEESQPGAKVVAVAGPSAGPSVPVARETHQRQTPLKRIVYHRPKKE